MEKYEVFIKARSRSGTFVGTNPWSYYFQADSFGHAEEQAKEYLDESDVIIRIERYDLA